MTAPDHTPYLLPTDLRTAEDAARWLSMQGNYSALMLASFLRDHLDRERRQACERGAEDCERRLAAMPPPPRRSGGEFSETEAKRATLRERALAFRAAARQP